VLKNINLNNSISTYYFNFGLFSSKSSFVKNIVTGEKNSSSGWGNGKPQIKYYKKFTYSNKTYIDIIVNKLERESECFKIIKEKEEENNKNKNKNPKIGNKAKNKLKILDRIKKFFNYQIIEVFVC